MQMNVLFSSSSLSILLTTAEKSLNLLTKYYSNVLIRSEQKNQFNVGLRWYENVAFMDDVARHSEIWKNKRRENTIEYDMSLIGMVLKNAFSSAYASQHFHHIFSRLNCSFSADKIVTLKPDLSWLSHFSLTKNTVRHATVQTKINELHFSLFCSVLLPVEIESMSLRSKIVLSSLFSHSLFFIWFSVRSASFAKSI